jgi:membrane protein required for colicin V production
MPVSWLDIILVVIMLLSGFLAMVRGFTREVLSIFSWAVAAVAALYLTPKYWTLVESYFPSPGFAQIAFAAGVFIVFLVVVSLITLRISDTVLDSRVGALDRTLGFLFGLARGFLLVAIVFILFSALARVQPEWVRNARSYNILQQTQVAIESLLPMNPEQYLPGSLKPGEEQPGAQPGAQPETPGEAAPGAGPDAAPAAPAAPAQQSDVEKPGESATTPAETDTQR